MDTETAVKNLSVLRIAIGVFSWLMPNLAGKAFLLDVSGNPQAPYLARLFGVRDIALGAATQQLDGDARRQLLTLGVAVDAADTAAALLGTRAGYFSKVTGLVLASVAASAAAMGIMALQGDDGPPAG